MKNFLLGLNIVLLVAVGFLYYKNFAKNGKTDKPAKNYDTILPFTNRIAYFIVDSVESIEFYRNKFKEVEDLKASGNAAIESAQKNYASRYAYYNQLLSQSPTPENEAKAKNELMKLQEDMDKQKRELDTKLFEKNNDVLSEIRKDIQDYMKEYNKAKGFSYIISDAANLFFYKDSLLNVTDDVIKGLNEKYKKTKQ